MNKEKIAEELNAWTASEVGFDFETDIYNDDLTLFYDDECIAWFTNFETDKFGFVSPSNYRVSIELTQKDVIKKFYEKGVELLSKHEPKYTVKIIKNSDDGFLNYKNSTGEWFLSDNQQGVGLKAQFTRSEIDDMKNNENLAFDWNKAIIKEVE